MGLEVIHRSHGDVTTLDVVKVHYVRLNKKKESCFFVTYRNPRTGKEWRKQIGEGDVVKIAGEDMPWWLRSKVEVDKVYELMQEKLLGPEYVKLKAESKK